MLSSLSLLSLLLLFIIKIPINKLRAMNDSSQETAVASLMSTDDDDDMILAVCEAALVTATASATMMENFNLYQPIIYDQDSTWGGSVKGNKRKNKYCNFVMAHEGLIRDYFSGKDSVYDEKDFERRFRVPRELFIKIYKACLHTPPFVFPKDALGNKGIHPLDYLHHGIAPISSGINAQFQNMVNIKVDIKVKQSSWKR
jgi:hypothetical protein